MAKSDTPAAAFSSPRLRPAPDTGQHPVAPPRTSTAPPPSGADPQSTTTELVQFSARLDPSIVRQVKIAVATDGITVQDAAREAWLMWLANRSS